MKNGLGSVKGLSVLEHVEWATAQSHPASAVWSVTDYDLETALRYECSEDPADVDGYRLPLLEECVHAAVTLEQSRLCWAAEAGHAREPLARKLHGPLLK